MNQYEITHKGKKYVLMSIDGLMKTLIDFCTEENINPNEVESCVLIPKKNKCLVFSIESTSFIIPDQHGILKLKVPFGWDKIKHYKAGMKVKVKLIKQ